jgi:hypothetical protein
VRDGALTQIVRLLRHFGAFLVLCAIEAVSCLLLFGSKRLLDHLGLATVAREWRSVVSPVFLLVSFLVILRVVDFFNRRILDRWER